MSIRQLVRLHKSFSMSKAFKVSCFSASKIFSEHFHNSIQSFSTSTETFSSAFAKRCRVDKDWDRTRHANGPITSDFDFVTESLAND